MTNTWNGNGAPPGTWQHGEASGLPASGIPASGGAGDRPPLGAAIADTARPAAPGNALTLKDGSRSPRVYGRTAEELTAGLLADRPDLAAYPEAVAAWATAEAQAALMRRHLAEVGTIDPDTGEPRANSVKVLNGFESRAEKARAALGLDPLSDARLTRERAATDALNLHSASAMIELIERGRKALAERERLGIGTGGTADGTDCPALHPDIPGRVLAEVRAEGEAAQAAADRYRRAEREREREQARTTP